MESIHEDNPHVFVCRLGHVAKEASGYTRQDSLRCRKIVGEQPCRKKAIIIGTEVAQSLFSRGWKACHSTKSKHVCAPPSLMDAAFVITDLVNDIADEA